MASLISPLSAIECDSDGVPDCIPPQVREALDEEKAMVRAFHKRQREANSGEAAQEREGYKKRLLELEAEVKVARSLAAAQVDEASQTHAAELGALQRRVAELEDEKGKQQRSFEQRLADEKGHRYGDVQERERRRLAAEEAWKAQLAEARREAARALGVGLEEGGDDLLEERARLDDRGLGGGADARHPISFYASRRRR